MEGADRSVRISFLFYCRPLSKMNKEESLSSLKKEIVKCWDDGEVATYAQLIKLCSRAGVNTVAEVVSVCAHDS